jgi:tRNA-splicing ligase RtcB
MPVKQEISEGRVPVKVYTSELEPAARQQLVNISQLPIVHHHVAAMPDVHLGIGATVGSVIPTRRAIIPAAVGVDIGCGMMAARLSLTAEQVDEKSLRKVFDQISRDVPVGFEQHNDRDVRTEAARHFSRGLKRILEKHPGIQKNKKSKSSWAHQLGTLGGGNHFIEVCLDEGGGVWVMLHSGSRGIGNAIGTYFIQLAKKDFSKNHIHLPDADLAYFPEGAQHFDDYVEAVGWAQDYARANREEMMDLVLEAMRRHLPAFEVVRQAVNCHHNYVQQETHYGEKVWVTRKGAIRAGEGELGIIPGSMGSRSYIVRGRGNAESFDSCAHGAGRKMSRNAAKKCFSISDLKHQTSGVICRLDAAVLDEIPGAYKDIDEVMANQSDLVEVVHTLKQVLCVKG